MKGIILSLYNLFFIAFTLIMLMASWRKESRKFALIFSILMSALLGIALYQGVPGGLPYVLLITVIYCLGFYFIGSIPFGFILTQWAGLGDIRTIGSGNIGATNVLRTGRKGLAVATLLLDALKGFLTISLYETMIGVPNAPVICFFSFLVILGHIFPVWLNFKGGKGVAPTLGVYLWLLGPWKSLLILGLWFVTARIWKYSSLASLVSVTAALPLGFRVYGIPGGIWFVAIAGLIWYRHTDNLKRLLRGTESKIGESLEEPS